MGYADAVLAQITCLEGEADGYIGAWVRSLSAATGALHFLHQAAQVEVRNGPQKLSG